MQNVGVAVRGVFVTVWLLCGENEYGLRERASEVAVGVLIEADRLVILACRDDLTAEGYYLAAELE